MAKSTNYFRNKAHESFDKIWKGGELTREDAYKWLSGILKINKKRCHIRFFNTETCKEVIYYSKQFMADMRDLDRSFGISA